MGRRERNKLKVKERLYDAAMTLFAEQGYNETSIDEIAEAADVARGTFFNYFQRKEDLLGAWGEKRRDALLATLDIEHDTAASAVGRLRYSMTALGRMNEGQRQQTAALLMAWVRAGRPLMEAPYLADLLARIAAEGILRGEFDDRFTARQIGNALRDLYLGTLYRWCGQPDGAPDQLTAELLTTLDLILEGILVAPATTP
ncbi:TetR/AcrR family transcriptional regulator [Kitasatospora sp. NPDC057198]|uniref:TetR/AcrR family transcriptional regulator n=1 Tax=Kitasatospora sp. NPDC057198 TaxID=3346046 RepID=UPI003628930F